MVYSGLCFEPVVIQIVRSKMLNKVIVIGSPGAGKSTFSRKLRDVTGLPLYYLDMLWHKPDRTTISREVFDTKLKGLQIYRLYYQKTSDGGRYKYIETYYANGIAEITQWMEVF